MARATAFGRLRAANGRRRTIRDTTWWSRGHLGRLSVETVLALAGGVAAFALAAVVCTAARDHVPALLLGFLLLLFVLVVARLAGIMYALPVGVVVVQAFDWYFLPPLRDFDAATAFVLALFLLVSVIVAAVTTQAGRRAVASEQARGDLAETQACLRRLAMLVARGEPPEVVFAAVTREVLRHFGTDTARMIRYELDGTATLLADEGATVPRVRDGERRENYPPAELTATVRRTGHAARIDDYHKIPGAEPAAHDGLRSAVAMPVHVDGRLWGLIAIGSGDGPLPPGTEQRLTDFTDLVATAVASAQSRTEVAASRARIVAASDETRRRIERDLHDGAQQRLVAVALRLNAVASAPSGDVRADTTEAASELMGVLDELREISRGIHPAILTDAGLRAALRALGRRSVVPVELDVRVEGRLPEPVEVAAYYVVSEMLTNAAKHARASVVEVAATAVDGMLRVCVRDDGVGGADPRLGSGLVGLRDRVEALGGAFSVDSPPDRGTAVVCELPIPTGAGPAALPTGPAGR